MFTPRINRCPSARRMLQRGFSATTAKRMTPQQMETVKLTIPALQQHGVAITTLFYKNMLRENPQLRNMFNITHQLTGEQPAALAHAVLAYATNIENPAVLLPVVSRIAHKHVSLGVTPEQYAVVGENLLGAIQQTLGTAATPAILDAWKAAYGQLAKIFIDFEGGLYEDAQKTPGGWKGWRKFVLAATKQESDDIVSFHLSPVDGQALPTFKPGQFVSVRCYVPELKAYQPRQYSLSDIPNQTHFQISVKREPGSHVRPAGRVSNVLHRGLAVGSEVEVSMPFGDFVLDTTATTPVVLVSGGVGQTPMMTMLKTAIAQPTERKVVYVHAARSGRAHAMKDELGAVMATRSDIDRVVFYEEITDADTQGEDYDHVGRVDMLKIKDKVLLPEADYYICGPAPFIKAQCKALKEMGVVDGKVHSELFGSPTE